MSESHMESADSRTPSPEPPEPADDSDYCPDSSSPVTPRRRTKKKSRTSTRRASISTDTDDDDAVASSANTPQTPKTPTSKKRKKDKVLEASPFKSPYKKNRRIQRERYEFPTWADDSCPLFTMPSDIADTILSSPHLGLRDHLALAATCKTLRTAYTEDVWHALLRQRRIVDTRPLDHQPESVTTADTALLSHFFSARPMRSNANVPTMRHGTLVRDPGHERAIEEVHTGRLTQSQSKSLYKITVQQITALRCTRVKNRKALEHPIELYLETAVEALAFRAHGGPLGHAQHLARCREIATKAATSRQRNGTNRMPSRSSWFYGGYGYGFRNYTHGSHYGYSDLTYDWY